MSFPPRKIASSSALNTALGRAGELPGLKQDDIDIDYRDREVTIAGEKKEQSESKKGGCIISERRYGSSGSSGTGMSSPGIPGSYSGGSSKGASLGGALGGVSGGDGGAILSGGLGVGCVGITFPLGMSFQCMIPSAAFDIPEQYAVRWDGQVLSFRMFTMKAMQLDAIGGPLMPVDRAVPTPKSGEVLIAVSACGVCRTDLHILDGEVPASFPIVPGHEIVGRILALGEGVTGLALGQRVGVPWLGKTCGRCPYCLSGRENLCDAPEFTGATRDGGYATHIVADARYCFAIPDRFSDIEAAPLLCAGLIGWRALRLAGDAHAVGLYGFGAAAHILAQVAVWQGRKVFAFTKPGDTAGQQFARSLGCTWAGASDQPAPKALDAALIFAPVGNLVPIALKAVRKGGKVVCAGIHMTDIPRFPYADLWEERQILSVANLTREDGMSFFEAAEASGLRTVTTEFPLAEANAALASLRAGHVAGAAVLRP